MSALHPDGLSLQRKVAFRRSIFMIKPDLILAQSGELEEMFTRFGYRTRFFPSGVDVRRFHPRSLQSKEQLREKYGIERDKFIILHVGHIKRDRNVQAFSQIQDKSRQVFIVASSYRGGGDKRLYHELSQIGCIIWRGYFPNIEEIYALADCYVFPAHGDGCLLLPLSVMEAMACNLPVVTTGFGALPTMFSEGDGLFFTKTEKDFLPLLDKIKSGDVEVNTRKKVLPYTWENVTEELERVYTQVMSEDGD
jgi:glycosyltransferase involved in cell wall biosynthesis